MVLAREGGTTFLAQGVPEVDVLRLRLPWFFCRDSPTAHQGGRVEDRVRFEQATAKDFPGDGYDLACFFDSRHDMGDLRGAAEYTRQKLKADGTVLLPSSTDVAARDCLRSVLLRDPTRCGEARRSRARS